MAQHLYPPHKICWVRDLCTHKVVENVLLMNLDRDQCLSRPALPQGQLPQANKIEKRREHGRDLVVCQRHGSAVVPSTVQRVLAVVCPQKLEAEQRALCRKAPLELANVLGGNFQRCSLTPRAVYTSVDRFLR